MTITVDLSGRVAVVTGGSRGMGRSVVLGLARAGADVVVASRNYDNCREVAQLVERETGRRALAHACHVGRWEQCQELFDAAYTTFERVDILVNNAGLAPTYDRATTVSEKLFDAVMAVNLKGPFRLMALFAERMQEDGSGTIINIGSITGDRPRPDVLPYGASKAGLTSLTKGFAQAYGPTVRVNAVIAGPFLTDMSRGWDMVAFAERARSRIAMQRGGQPDEIVGAVLYFASDASSFTTGAELRVDGGAL
jgi:NAD(P)-dependent dehydrogenase (short-subunit alcohol dehydrogenase family)